MTSYAEWLEVKAKSRAAYDAELVRIEEEKRLEALEWEKNAAERELERLRLMKTFVVWQSYKKETPNRGYWDYQILEDIFSRQMWSPVLANEFEHVNSIQDVPRKAEGCIIIIPARHHAHEQWLDKLNDDMVRFKWCIFMAIGDEESEFPIWRLKHRNCRIWLQMPRDQQNKHEKVHVKLLNGYPTDMRKYAGKFKEEELSKPIDWSFAGQDTHYRRHIFVEYGQSIGGMPGPEFGTGAVLIKTEGFTQGIEHDKYYELMASSKIVPCPSGAAAPDSFRFAEALESGCIPLADNRSSNANYPPGYWSYVFDEEPPFPIVDDWRSFPSILLDTMKNWKPLANKIGSWWLQYKRKLTYKLEDDINLMTGKTPEAKSVHDKITVLISSSPIPSHPSAWMIKETIASIRGHLPDCEILIMQDGVRPEQEHMREAYETYKQELLFACRNEYHNVLPIFFDEFLHQAEMTRRTLPQVKTPHILFVEHDTPLCEDQKIEWYGIVKLIESGWTDSVRLAHMDSPYIHPEHEHLMIDKCRQDVCGIQAVRTRQYSQRPHIATKDLYERMLSTFSENCRTFIEDNVYGQFYPDKTPYKLAIYTPDGPIKRSRDLNGREGGVKYDDRLVF